MSNIIKETLIKIKEIKLKKKNDKISFKENKKNYIKKDLSNEEIFCNDDYKEEYINNPFQENIRDINNSDIILFEKIIDLNNYIRNYNVTFSDEMKIELKFLRDKLNLILDQ